VDIRLGLTADGPVQPWRAAATRGADLPSGHVAATARALTGSATGSFLLSGGEPLRRADLASLLAELHSIRAEDLGLVTAGEGMTRAVAERLLALGVCRVHIPFHCARQDAHDWLFGRPGALKSAHRAIRACVDADLPVNAEIMLTRPGMPHLAETVGVLSRLGVRAVTLRRLRRQDVSGDEFVPLSPRLGLARESLERAAAMALQRRVTLRLREFPVCVAPRLRPLFAPPASEIWADAEGEARPPQAALGCADCPGLPRCAGAPPDYIERFGWEELVKPETRTARVIETVAEQRRPAAGDAMVFSWRGPHRVRCEECGDDGAGRAREPYESTRVIRARLVEAARYRPGLLRLVGADLLAHPRAAALIFDALRLFGRVEVAGEASAAVDWTDLELRRLKDLGRLDVALYGADAVSHDAHCGIPGAFAATLRAASRLQDAGIAVGAYAILHDARALPAFAAAWSDGRLPGAPRFRLSPRGTTLQELLRGAGALPAGAARAALLAVLPRCLRCGDELAQPSEVPPVRLEQHTVFGGRTFPYQPCGSDPIGAFETCQEEAGVCAQAGCPGRATGWRDTERSQRWSGSN
jgi:MoaA/NifB/PqqE/SkfB family radical SAM enzyme